MVRINRCLNSSGSPKFDQVVGNHSYIDHTIPADPAERFETNFRIWSEFDYESFLLVGGVLSASWMHFTF